MADAEEEAAAKATASLMTTPLYAPVAITRPCAEALLD
jgi:hypothetical protein